MGRVPPEARTERKWLWLVVLHAVECGCYEARRRKSKGCGSDRKKRNSLFIGDVIDSVENPKGSVDPWFDCQGILKGCQI